MTSTSSVDSGGNGRVSAGNTHYLYRSLRAPKYIMTNITDRQLVDYGSVPFCVTSVSSSGLWGGPLDQERRCITK